MPSSRLLLCLAIAVASSPLHSKLRPSKSESTSPLFRPCRFYASLTHCPYWPTAFHMLNRPISPDVMSLHA
jgi:hypothetical protein